MSESFVSSGENSDIVSGPPPQLQGLSLPGIDNPQFVDGFGIVTPWGGGGTTRRYADYGITTDRQTQLNDLASAFIPAGGGGISFGLEGERGPQGVQGLQGLPGIISLIGLNFPANSNFLTELPHNLDLINGLGTAIDKLIYTSAYTAYRNFVWEQTSIDSVNSWNDSDINMDASFLIIAADAGIYISTDDGDNWGKDNPDEDTYIQTSCAATGGKAVVLGNTGRTTGKIWTTSNYGGAWTEKGGGTVGDPTGADLVSGTTNGNTLPEPWPPTEPETRVINFGGGVALTQGVTYAIVVRAVDAVDAADSALWQMIADGSEYGGVAHFYSTDGGSNWTSQSPAKVWFKTYDGYPTLRQNCTFSYTGAGAWLYGSAYWSAMTFTAHMDYTLTDVALKLYRVAGSTPGTITVSIRATTIVPNIREVQLGSGGNFLVAAAEDGAYLSTDFGDNWARKTPDGVEDTDWVKGICSSDGTYIIVVSSANAIYRSANNGTSWAAITPAGGDTFSVNKLATSDSGQYMVIVGQNSTDLTESCYISVNYGVTWTAKKPVTDSIEWTDCDISNDGTIIAVSTSAYFYISFDSGTTWKEQGMASTAQNWAGLSISGDGTIGLITNLDNNDEFFIGTNTELYSEATWAESDLTSAGRALLDDTDAAAQATTIGVGTGDSPTWAGATLSGLADDSVVFVDNSGVLSENNSAFNWNDALGRLDITSILRIKDSGGTVIFYVDDDELYFTASITIPIEAGMPIGLALALTYASA